MPVLDAKALERDPKGAAFLLAVLRQGSARRAKFLGLGTRSRLLAGESREMVAGRLSTQG